MKYAATFYFRASNFFSKVDQWKIVSAVCMSALCCAICAALSYCSGMHAFVQTLRVLGASQRRHAQFFLSLPARAELNCYPDTLSER